MHTSSLRGSVAVWDYRWSDSWSGPGEIGTRSASPPKNVGGTWREPSDRSRRQLP